VVLRLGPGLLRTATDKPGDQILELDRGEVEVRYFKALFPGAVVLLLGMLMAALADSSIQGHRDRADAAEVEAARLLKEVDRMTAEVEISDAMVFELFEELEKSEDVSALHERYGTALELLIECEAVLSYERATLLVECIQ
jgi:hypothetical protein